MKTWADLASNAAFELSKGILSESCLSLLLVLGTSHDSVVEYLRRRRDWGA